MFEGKIILPLLDQTQSNDEETIEMNDRAHEALRRRLGDAFGGFTYHYGHGWTERYGDEPVGVYTVAAEPSIANIQRLKAIAISVGMMAGQDIIYWKDFAGEVAMEDLEVHRVAVQGGKVEYDHARLSDDGNPHPHPADDMDRTKGFSVDPQSFVT